MSYAYEMGLRGGICNGCSLEQLKWRLGKDFLFLQSGIYEIGAEPTEGQGEPKEHDGKPIRFHMWGMSYEHSDECYHWRPPKLVWTTATGEKIKIADMNDAHLINTIRLLERSSHTHFDIYWALLKEMKKRKGGNYVEVGKDNQKRH